MYNLRDLVERWAHPGQVVWLSLRSERKADVRAVQTAEITMTGCVRDHKSTPGKRAFTLIQAEHLLVISARAPRPATFADLRRNIAIAGINLVGLRGREIRRGTARLRIAGPCAPCSRLEEVLATAVMLLPCAGMVPSPHRLCSSVALQLETLSSPWLRRTGLPRWSIWS